MTRLYSRAQYGARAVGKVPKGKHHNLTIVGAVALDGVRALSAYEGGTTNEAFRTFVTNALVPSLHPNDIVIMDNLRAHHAEDIQGLINACGAQVLFLPPYSPEFNPIERAWSKMKTFFRQTAARTIHELIVAIPRIRDTIQLSDLAGWFRLSGYTNQCN